MLTIRHIQTKTVPVLDAEQQPVTKDGAPVTQVVPDLDVNGDEIVLWSIDIPRAIEAEGGEVIDAYVAAQVAKLAAGTAPTVPAPVAAPEEHAE